MIRYSRNHEYRFYKGGTWKYVLHGPYTHATGIVGCLGGDAWVSITPDGTLRISDGYAWDGASGPAIDTPSFIRASLVHDALYQLIRHGVVTDRRAADGLLRDIAREDGMWYVRSLWVYAAVRLFGGLFMKLPESQLQA